MSDIGDDDDTPLCPSLLDLFLEVTTAAGMTMTMITIMAIPAIMAIPLTVLHHGLRSLTTFSSGSRVALEDSRSW